MSDRAARARLGRDCFLGSRARPVVSRDCFSTGECARWSVETVSRFESGGEGEARNGRRSAARMLGGPDAFIARLASLVPRPHKNQIVYFGALSAHAKRREAIVPCDELDRCTRPDSSWAALTKHSFGLSVLKCRCRSVRAATTVAEVHRGGDRRRRGTPPARPPRRARNQRSCRLRSSTAPPTSGTRGSACVWDVRGGAAIVLTERERQGPASSETSGAGVHQTQWKTSPPKSRQAAPSGHGGSEPHAHVPST